MKDDSARTTTGGAALSIGALVIFGSIMAFVSSIVLGFLSSDGVSIRAILTFLVFGGIGVFSGFMFIMAGREMLHRNEEESTSNGE